MPAMWDHAPSTLGHVPPGAAARRAGFQPCVRQQLCWAPGQACTCRRLLDPRKQSRLLNTIRRPPWLKAVLAYR